MEVDEPSHDADDADPKEQRPKRDKKKKRQNEEDADGDADSEAASRHKSILEKKSKSLQMASEAPAAPEDDADDEEPALTYALGPLPQPEPVLPDTSAPTYSTLPEWLSAPIAVSQTTRVPFSTLGLPAAVAAHLAAKGFPDAFAVQTAAIPLLTPSSKTHASDLLVAAATGSGKTLAYALPVVRDVSTSIVTRLRTLVVLPTRELAAQAKEAFELCAAAWGEERGHKRVKIAVSIGSQVFKQEQDALVDRCMRYDPPARKKLRARDSDVDEEEDDDLEDLSDGEGFDDLLPGHVWEYTSKVDVLICTPGRLVEHMAQTPGFSLDHVRWLVVDEADKLLAESYQGWIDAVMPKLRSDGEGALLNARAFPGSAATGVRKVLLSATLTRDLGLLAPLQLRRPRLVVLQGDGAHAEHVLPEGLSEMAVRVREASMKPLYLVELLEGGHLGSGAVAPADDSDSDATSSDSDSDSSSSDGPSSRKPSSSTKKTYATTALVFTKSNESALRLARLLALLIPSLSTAPDSIQTLTSGTPTATRRRILRAFAQRRTRVVVASDLVARGIDIAGLDHVVNYDVPASVAAYVHRVGRTARAGRPGQAWTLVEDGESGWFWGKIGKGALIKRASAFKRVKVGGDDGWGEDRVQRYEEVLAQVGAEAQEGRKRGEKR
jgi:ATP-dependent RNA helicase DDX51/DBP6